MRTLFPCLVLLFCMASISLLAQERKPLFAIPPDGFQFSGTWDCEGAMGNGKVHKSTFTGATILDGKWLELTEQDRQPETGYVAKYLLGYDSQRARLVEFDANNFGAATYSSDQGWKNSGLNTTSLTMTSAISQDTKAPYAADRFLYSITGPNTFTVDWQISKTPALDWKPGDHLLCHRRSQ